MNQQALDKLVRQVGAVLQQGEASLATAESCTGGWVSQALTAIAGSSAWFECGYVTYSNEAKHRMLGVDLKTLDQQGAVSEQVACEMVKGAIASSRASYALAVTGIAGPAGGSEEKPVGTVCFAWADNHKAYQHCTEHFQGDRQAVRLQSVVFALQGLLAFISGVKLPSRR